MEASHFLQMTRFLAYCIFVFRLAIVRFTVSYHTVEFEL